MSLITWHDRAVSSRQPSVRTIPPGWSFLGAAVVSLAIWAGFIELVLRAIA